MKFPNLDALLYSLVIRYNVFSFYFCYFHNEVTLYKEVKRNDVLKWAPLDRLINLLLLLIVPYFVRISVTV